MKDKPTKKELFVKSLIYRFFVVLYESILGLFIGWLGINILGFVIINNTIKILVYFMVELWWFGYIRTRLQLVQKWIIDKLRNKNKH